MTSRSRSDADTWQSFVLDLDQFGRIRRGVAVLGNDKGHFLVLEQHFAVGEHHLHVAGKRRHPGEIDGLESFRGDHRHDAGHCGGLGRVDLLDAGVRVRGTREIAVQHAVAKPEERSFWIAVVCGALILSIGIGARQSFGIFQKPIAADLGVGREVWSFANALALLLMGGLSPFVGNISDRFGTARTVASGGALYVVGMAITSWSAQAMA